MERNICGDFALDSLDVLQDTNVTDRVLAVTVTRDDGNADHPGSDPAADAPGSSCDLKAEADGREIPRLQLYADLTYSPCYIDKSLYARS